MIRFETPWAFLLLIAAVLPFVWRRVRSGPGPAVRFSGVRLADDGGPSLRVRLLGLPGALRFLALVLLVIALARPQQGYEQVRERTEGIALMMVVDRSGSMSEAMQFRGTRTNRLAVVKEVFRQFVGGNGRDLAGRPSDLVGMVAFARYADTVCPPTLGHDALLSFLDTVRLAETRREDGTALGDAVALAAARLQTVEETLARQTDEEASRYSLKSKVIILLTDGQNNCGTRSPAEAAELAAKWGIRIHAIGVGNRRGRVIRTPLGDVPLGLGTDGVDERALRLLAEKTGGIFRLADDEDSLREVYAEIDRLERSEIEAIRFASYRERFVPFAAAGLSLLALEILLATTVLRRVP